MPDLSDLNYVRSVLDLLDADLFGVPLKSLLDAVLLVLVLYGALTRGARLARWAKCKLLGGDKTGGPRVLEFGAESCSDPQKDDSPTAEMSPAGSAAYDALCFEQCVYDAAKRQLHLPGLMVEFVGDDPHSRTVKHLLASPCEGTPGRWLGDDLEKILDADEKDAVIAKAQGKREECVSRDRAAANRAAARGLSKAAHAARLKAYDEPAEGGYELTTGADSPAAQTARKWLGPNRGRVPVLPKSNHADKPA